MKKYFLCWKLKVCRYWYRNVTKGIALLGVSRAPLQLAWDFTTASEACLTGRLLYARDDALKKIGNNGTYRVIRVQNNYSKDIYRLHIYCFVNSALLLMA